VYLLYLLFHPDQGPRLISMGIEILFHINTTLVLLIKNILKINHLGFLSKNISFSLKDKRILLFIVCMIFLLFQFNKKICFLTDWYDIIQ